MNTKPCEFPGNHGPHDYTPYAGSLWLDHCPGVGPKKEKE